MQPEHEEPTQSHTMDYWADLPSTRAKQRDRDRIAKDIEAFLQAGGVIEHVDDHLDQGDHRANHRFDISKEAKHRRHFNRGTKDNG